MTQKVIHIRIAGIILAVLAVFLVILGIKYLRDTRALRGELNETTEKVEFYEIVVDSMKETVAETKLRLVEKEKQLSLTEQQIERLEEANIQHVKVIGQLKASVSVYKDSLKVKPDTVKVVQRVIDSVKYNCVPLGSYWDFDDEWVYQWAGIDATGTGDIGFIMKQSPINLTIGQKGLLGRQEVVNVSTPNPYLNIYPQDVQMVIKKNKAPYYWAVGGFLIGGAATLLLLGVGD